jgi:starch-binding outer membrane protein, SusD/RagB family
MNLTKRIKFLIIFFTCMTVVYMACKKEELEIPPPTQTEASFFTSEAEFRTAVIGIYAGITDYYSASNSAGGFGSAELESFFLPGDDLTHTGGSSFEHFDGLTAGNGKLAQVFGSSYIILGRANKVLDKLRTVEPGIFKTPGLKEANEGEALFLRGFVHFMLWNLFGTAPIDTITVTSPDQFNLPSSSGVQLLDQAVADLTRAASLLPTGAWDANNTGRVTAKSAYGMLGKVLVFRGNATGNAADYQAAIAAFNSITGASLTTDFYDNFSVLTENNQESLFEFQAGKNIISSGQNAWLGNDVCDCGVTGSYFQMFYDGAGTYMAGGRYRPTAKLVAAFEADDPRADLTFDGDKIVKYVLGGDELDGAVLSLNNHRILRYADVLLLKAEAILQSNGSTSEAIGLINQVRARARNMVGGGTSPADLNTGETNKTVIQQWIMDERLRELAGEGHRWFDLRRWHIANFIELNNAFFSSLNSDDMDFQETNLNFPIPTTETESNPNIVQNPGY